MDSTDKQLRILKQKVQEARQQKYLEDSKQRLIKIAETKMRTCFMGSISSIEDYFGFLWGKDVPTEQRSKEQDDFYEIWQQLRTEILNKGNTQLRGLTTEITNHVVSWNRYHIELPVITK